MRNQLHNTPTSVSAISEKTPVSSDSRARSHCFTGGHSVLLYTGRAHHFRCYLRGVASVVFYGLPDNSLFSRKIAGAFIRRSMGEGRITALPMVRVIFSKWDAISWRGSLVARGSGLCVRIKVTRLSLFDGPQ